MLALVVTVTSPPLWIPRVSVGLDSSWQAAMHLAARNGLDFGSGVDFTYGPLGFLVIPSLYFVSTGVMAGLFTFGVRVATLVAVLGSARRALGLGLALACTYLVAQWFRWVDIPQTIPVLLLAVCLGVLRRSDSERHTWFPAAAGGVAAFLLLVKFNVGLVALGLGVVTAWFTARRTWRAEGVLLASFVGSLLAGWLLTGNRVGDLPAWLSSSLHIASGYSTAMGVETDRNGDFLLLALVTAAVVTALWLGTAGWERAVRVAAFLVVGGVYFAAFKHAFVRHDGHVLSLFGVLPAVVLAFGLTRRRMLVAFAAVAFAFVSANHFKLREMLDPVPSLRNSAAFVADLSSVGDLRDEIVASRDLQRSSYALDPATLGALDGHGLHVDPWEASVLWAHPELEWRPLPVFQSYSAYTSSLDERNARALTAADGPTRILRETPRGADYRNPDFESPAAIRAMLCNFREVSATERWQVLARATNRCGRAERISITTVERGERVVVPEHRGAPALVMARIRGVEGSATAQAIAMLYKAPETHLELDDGTTYRLVPETAAGPLLMAAPPELGYTATFGFNVPIRGFRLVQRHGLGPDRFGRVTVEFLRIPLRPVEPAVGP